MHIAAIQTTVCKVDLECSCSRIISGGIGNMTSHAEAVKQILKQQEKMQKEQLEKAKAKYYTDAVRSW